MKKIVKENKAITLIALVITIVVLIILAGVAINLTLGQNGIFTKAREARDNYIKAAQEEQEGLDDLVGQIEEDTKAELNKANEPKLLTGMTPIKFTMPTEEKMGETVETNAQDKDWYQYGITYNTKRWANAKTEDGSMWVWIPRYAYRVNKETETFDIVFLQGTTDNYYDENGNLQTAKRQKSVDETIDTTTGYTVHPAFTNESSINYANGGWDKELTGIWVAKFAAGYASGNNNAPVKASSVNYTQTISWVNATERGADDKKDGSMEARNWLDGIYGKTTTSIKYPTFQGITYAMNYINVNDSYNIAKVLNESGNIYGLSATDSDSHLMKNSEWGAIAYLSASKYGQNQKEITVNNINLNSGNKKRTETTGKSGVDSVYAVTGCTTNSTNASSKNTTIESIKGVTGNKANEQGTYIWNQKTGQNASTTGTIYGVYDMSGCVWEKIASYIANGHDYLKKYGASVAYNGNTLKTTSTKYTTVYTNSESGQTDRDTASQLNFKNNTKIYGDAVRETNSEKAGTSEEGWNISSWKNDYSCFPALSYPFFERGGNLWRGSSAGIFSFARSHGDSSYANGLRAVLVNS